MIIFFKMEVQFKGFSFIENIYDVRHCPKHQVFYFDRVFSEEDVWMNKVL